ncbi:MAG: hypothetical protein ACRDTD_22715, partial [Pseudonocardiaceae bacterium]
MEMENPRSAAESHQNVQERAGEKPAEDTAEVTPHSGPLGPGAGEDAGDAICDACGRRLAKRGQRGPQRTTCRPEHTWWQIDDRKTSCEEVARGWRINEVTRGTAIPAGAPPDLVALAEHVDTLLAPLQLLTARSVPLTELLAALRDRLESEVATARGERETALAEARAQRELRAVAVQRETEALETADQERRVAAKAQQAQLDAETAKDAAVAERATLHATLQTEIADRQRIAANLEGAVAAKDRVEHEKIALTTELELLRAERDRLRGQAEQTLGAHHLEIGRLHSEHQAELNAQRGELEIAHRADRDRYAVDLAALRTEASRAHQQE